MRRLNNDFPPLIQRINRLKLQIYACWSWAWQIHRSILHRVSEHSQHYCYRSTRFIQRMWMIISFKWCFIGLMLLNLKFQLLQMKKSLNMYFNSNLYFKLFKKTILSWCKGKSNLKKSSLLCHCNLVHWLKLMNF